VSTRLDPFYESEAVDVRSVANTFLELADCRTLALTNLKLQKLLFFAHADALATEHRAMVRQAFEAWQMGPVVKVAYDQFKKFRDRPILEPAKAFDLSTQTWVAVPSMTANHQFRKFAERTLRTYGQVSAFHLSELSHQKGGPWDLVRNSRSGQANLALQIPNELIYQHFIASRDFKSLN
jgi:uncharacterized phage-associated protein